MIILMMPFSALRYIKNSWLETREMGINLPSVALKHLVVPISRRLRATVGITAVQ